MIEINRASADGRAEYELLARLRERGEQTGAVVTERVNAILETVRREGDKALFEYTKKFDGVELEALEVPREEINDALTGADSRFTEALLNALENISNFHNRQKRQSFIDARPEGTILGQRVRGLTRVGLYVPGGTAAYPSSVLMNAVPAKIAGVEELIMVTPPSKNGRANPDIYLHRGHPGRRAHHYRLRQQPAWGTKPGQGLPGQLQQCVCPNRPAGGRQRPAQNVGELWF